MEPGATPFTRMPLGARCLVSDRTKLVVAALVRAQSYNSPYGVVACSEVVAIIAAWGKCGRAADREPL